MKFRTLLLPLLFALTSQAQIHYEVNCNGLDYPELDGGRTELEFADINQDGNPDIVSIGDHGSPFFNTDQHGVMVWFGDGQGNFDVQQTGDFGYGGIATGDVNNDGNLDVGYGMHHNYSGVDLGDQLIEVALGDGSGTAWIPWDDGLASNGEDWGMFGTDFGDVDNDGDLDIVSISFGGSAGLHVYTNHMDGTWSQSFGFLGGNSDEIVLFGDINNDGFLDIAAGHQFGTAYFGDGTGDFENRDDNLPESSYSLKGIDLGDADNDGGKDLSFINENGAPEVWHWSNANNQWEDISGSLPDSGEYEMTALADMDIDGNVDLVAYGSGSGTIWLGDGSGQWEETTNFSTAEEGSCQALRAGSDTDHNGHPDIALVAEVPEGMFMYQNYLYGLRETSVAEDLSVSGLYPGGDEIFYSGSIRCIRWITEVPGNDSSWIDIALSLNGASGPWNTVAQNIPDNGRYQWTIPEANTENGLLRYTVHTQQSQQTYTMQQPFTIVHETTTRINSSDAADTKRLKIYPNPANRYVVLKSTSCAAAGKAFLEITDLTGKKWLTSHTGKVYLQGSIKIPVAKLPVGTYIISLQTPHSTCRNLFIKK